MDQIRFSENIKIDFQIWFKVSKFALKLWNIDIFIVIFNNIQLISLLIEKMP